MTFRQQLDLAYTVKVEGTLEKSVRKSALAADAALVRNTPVDTGRARANWIPSLDAASAEIVEPNGKKDIASETQSYTIDKTIFITNNLPYIQRLNDGWSQQAPAGFVELAVQSGVRSANGL